MADQNEDGKLDFKDFTAMAESVGRKKERR